MGLLEAESAARGIGGAKGGVGKGQVTLQGSVTAETRKEGLLGSGARGLGADQDPVELRGTGTVWCGDVIGGCPRGIGAMTASPHAFWGQR